MSIWSDLNRGKIKSSKIERMLGPFPAMRHGFMYKESRFPVRQGTLFYVIYDTKKDETFMTDMSKKIIPLKNFLTMFGQYKKASDGLIREIYLKPYKVVLTKRMRERDTINRYFVKYKLDKYERVFEISKSDFNSQTNLYDKIFITWQLKGSKENILMKNKKSLELAEDSLHGIQNFLDPLEFYEEDITSVEQLQKKLSRLKFVPDSTDTSSDPPSGWSAGDGPPPGSGY
jgi:hypothetical protein